MKVVMFAFIMWCSFFNKISSQNPFKNTVWVSIITSHCIDTLKFMNDGRGYSYSCEIDYTSKGLYRVDGRKVVLNIIEDSHGKSEMWRYKFFLDNEFLVPISSEQKWKGKWELRKTTFDNSYVFVRLKYFYK